MNIRDAFLALYRGLDLLKKFRYGYDDRCTLFLLIATTDQADVLQTPVRPSSRASSTIAIVTLLSTPGLIHCMPAIAGARSGALEVQAAGY
jgi:hypothetical protein